MKRFPWMWVLLLLGGVWIGVAGVTRVARKAVPTPESVGTYLEANPLGERSAAERGRVLEKVAGDLNRMGWEQRREVRMERGLAGFFKELTAEEQARFLDLTLPSGFKQLMEALNRMEPEKRRRFVDKALEDMRRRGREEGAGGNGPELDDNARKIVEQGFKAFYADASVEVKMDVAPLIEALQKNLHRSP